MESFLNRMGFLLDRSSLPALAGSCISVASELLRVKQRRGGGVGWRLLSSRRRGRRSLTLFPPRCAFYSKAKLERFRARGWESKRKSLGNLAARFDLSAARGGIISLVASRPFPSCLSRCSSSVVLSGHSSARRGRTFDAHALCACLIAASQSSEVDSVARCPFFLAFSRVPGGPSQNGSREKAASRAGRAGVLAGLLGEGNEL